MAHEIPPQIKKSVEAMLDAISNEALPQVMAIVTFPNDEKPMNAWSATNTMVLLFDYMFKIKLDFKTATAEKIADAFQKIDYRGFKQWNSIERRVKAGSSASYILVPLFGKVKQWRVTDTDGNTNISWVKPKDIKTGWKAEQFEKEIIRGFKGVPVFDISDTWGKPVKKVKLKLGQLPFKSVADHLGIKVIPKGFANKDYGFYAPQRQLIVLRSPDHAVFLHELSHAVDNHLLQKKGKKLKGGQNKEQEIIAEFSAAVLSNMIDPKNPIPTKNAAYYINGYSGGKRAEEMLKVLSRVESIITYITNFKEAKSPTRQAREKAGTPISEDAQIADKPKQTEPQLTFLPYVIIKDENTKLWNVKNQDTGEIIPKTYKQQGRAKKEMDRLNNKWRETNKK